MTQPKQLVFSCATCHALLDSAEAHKAHFRSDWHQHNLKRKISELPPLTEATFIQRGELYKNGTQEDSNKKARKASSDYYCLACSKHFSSEKALRNHCQSKMHGAKKHGNILNTQVPDLEIHEDATEEEINIAIESKVSSSKRLSQMDCLFCKHLENSFEDNLRHMCQVHSFYIPDIEYCVNLAGLLEYLADKISVAHCCLYCPASIQPFSSLDAVRNHMVDKCHSKIRFDDEGFQEVSEFYEYILSDDEDEDFIDIADEDVINLSDDMGSYALVVSPDETEMILPSGRRVGHRDYRIYYKQNLRTSPEPRLTRRNVYQQQLIARMSDQAVAMGTTGARGRDHLVRDQRYRDKMRQEWDLKLGVTNNSLQEHFRYQLRQ